MIKAIAFDAVGTLMFADPAVATIYERKGRRCGSRLTEAEIQERFRHAMAREFPATRDWPQLVTSEAIELLRWRSVVAAVLSDVRDVDECFRQLFAHFAKPTSWSLYDDVATFWVRCRRAGLQIALASNFDSRLHRIAAELPPLATSDAVLVSAEVGFRKPHPQFFSALAGRLQLPPDEILFIGDDPVVDCEGARQAGMSAVLIDRHGRTDRAIRSLIELPLRWKPLSA